jgi:hypothetical protein
MNLGWLVSLLIVLAGPPRRAADSPPQRRFTALGSAAERGDLQQVQELLASGLDAEGLDLQPDLAPTDRPLARAAARGHLAVVRALLEAGANPDACCCSCVTALHRALEGRHLEVLRALLEAGASPLLLYDGTVTPREQARRTGDVTLMGLIEEGLTSYQASTGVEEKGFAVRLPGRWNSVAEGASVAYRSQDGREQLTVTAMPSNVKMSKAQRAETVRALVKHRRAAEEKELGSASAEAPTFREAGTLARGGYLGEFPTAGRRLATFVVASPKGAWVFFLESAERSPAAFRTQARALMATVRVDR